LQPDIGADVGSNIVIAMDTSNDKNSASESQNHDETHDLAYKITSYLELLISLIRDKSTKPIAHLVNIATLCIIFFASIILLLSLVVIGVLRLLNNLVFAHHIWASYLGVGGIFFIVGLFLIKKVLIGRSKIV